jgi:hypothetical protein
MIVADQAYKGGALKIALNPEQIDTLRRHVAQVRRPRRSPQPPQEVSAGHPSVDPCRRPLDNQSRASG